MPVYDQVLVELPNGRFKVIRESTGEQTFKTKQMSENKITSINIGTEENPVTIVTAKERLKHFRGGNFEGYVTHQTYTEDEYTITVETKIYSPWPEVPGESNQALWIAHPYGKLEVVIQSRQIKESNEINTTSYLENASTHSLGRALAFLGIDIESGIPSSDEIANAVEQQEKIKTRKKEVRNDTNNKTKETFRDKARERAQAKKQAKATTQGDENVGPQGASGASAETSEGIDGGPNRQVDLEQSIAEVKGAVPPTETIVVEPAGTPRANMIVYYEHLRRNKAIDFRVVMASILQLQKDVKNGMMDNPEIQSVPITFRDFPSYYKDVPLPIGRLIYSRLAEEYKVDLKGKTLEEVAAESPKGK